MDIRTAIFNEIVIERRLQERYRTEGRFAMTCASPDMPMAQKLAVLAEEYGEAAHEHNEGFGEGRKTDIHKLGKELIQCAAVAVAWLESFGMTTDNAFASIREALNTIEPLNPEPFVELSKRYATVVRFATMVEQVSTIKPFLEYYTAVCILWLEQLDRQ